MRPVPVGDTDISKRTGNRGDGPRIANSDSNDINWRGAGPIEQEESISFLKKNKKLLLSWFTRAIRPARIVPRKCFLVLFLKKELLPVQVWRRRV